MAFKRQFGFWQIIIILSIIGLTALMFMYGMQPQTYEGRLKKADKLIQSKKFEEAITLYLSLIDQDPKNENNPALLLQVGDLYNFSLNNIDKAIQTYNKITVLYPMTEWTLKSIIRKSKLYFDTEQYDKALQEYQSILKNFPQVKDRATYQYQSSLCYLKLKQFEFARRELKKIESENPKSNLSDQVLLQTANSYFLEGKPLLAIPLYQALIDNYPKSEWRNEAKFNMADCYEDSGDFDRALKIYKEIQASYPNPTVIDLKIQKNKERQIEAEKRKKQALEDSKKLNALKQNNPAKNVSETLPGDFPNDLPLPPPKKKANKPDALQEIP